MIFFLAFLKVWGLDLLVIAIAMLAYSVGTSVRLALASRKGRRW